ncbi:GNAT family N-acetyltransferase [uncultured Oscillibacter sp.]|uniref:GNAT family N-acetyltransferase n=1 Tax=uncultured Oscillibacter sp. TaxID=876091 RepID=UPI0035A71E0A
MVTAWDRDRLAGPARVLDDGELTAYMHDVLVDPAYQGRHVGGRPAERVREKYRNTSTWRSCQRSGKTPLLRKARLSDHGGRRGHTGVSFQRQAGGSPKGPPPALFCICASLPGITPWAPPSQTRPWRWRRVPPGPESPRE